MKIGHFTRKCRTAQQSNNHLPCLEPIQNRVNPIQLLTKIVFLFYIVKSPRNALKATFYVQTNFCKIFILNREVLFKVNRILYWMGF